MLPGYQNPLQSAEEVRKVSDGQPSDFLIPPAQLLFREFQSIAIEIDKRARAGVSFLYYEWSFTLMEKERMRDNAKSIIVSQLEKRGYSVTMNDDTECYISW